jgi:hypothetical protein
MIIQGLFLFLTGPVMASFITDNLFEQASVWYDAAAAACLAV